MKQRRAGIQHATHAVIKTCQGYLALAMLAGMMGTNTILFAVIFWLRGVKLDDKESKSNADQFLRVDCSSVASGTDDLQHTVALEQDVLDISSTG